MYKPAKQDGYKGIKFRTGSHNFDRTTEVAKPRVVKSVFYSLKTEGITLSGGYPIATTVTSGGAPPPLMYTSLCIVKANTEHAP